MNVGDFVADAHDGVRVEGYRVAEHIKIRLDGSTAIVRQIMKSANLDHLIYCNKHVLVVDESISGIFKAVYSYDDMYLGVVAYQEVIRESF